MKVGAYPATRTDMDDPSVRRAGDSSKPGLFSEHREMCAALRVKLGQCLEPAAVEKVLALFEHPDVLSGAAEGPPEINRNPKTRKYNTTGKLLTFKRAVCVCVRARVCVCVCAVCVCVCVLAATRALSSFFCLCLHTRCRTDLRVGGPFCHQR